ncbi:Transposable element Tc3 transposase [Dictyocoela muelleri]|nr:Transposable element Tc3 transposase [Dictyocoela muelleri]
MNILTDDRLIFLDETGFNLHLTQKKGYSPKNTKAFSNVINSKGVNVSLLCAITSAGVLAHEIVIGSFKSSDILEFIESKLATLELNDRKYIIEDNASIHKTAEVREALNRKNFILMFLTSYSPQLNPIEEFFSCLKDRVK